MSDAERASTPTGSLAELLRKTVTQLRHPSHERGGDAVLYLGTRHQAFPTMIVTDPILEPVDKIVWMVLCRYCSTRDHQAAFPGHERISRDANVASRTTIARSLAILRAARWLSLCVRVRSHQGRFIGNVYALHDEPPSLREVMRLDRDYLSFLESARSHAHPRVRTVAAAVLTSIDDDIRRGVEVAAPVLEPERRLDAEQALNPARRRSYFSFSADVLTQLSNQPPTAHGDPPADSEDHVQNLDMALCSSGTKNIIPTTTALTANEACAREECEALKFPPSLTPNQRALAARYVASVSTGYRQSVLDELEGRIRASRRGAKPLYDPVRYLHRLCREAAAGRFASNLGDAVERERLESSSNAKVPSAPAAPAGLLRPSQIKPEWKPGDNPIQTIRERFNLPSHLGRT